MLKNSDPKRFANAISDNRVDSTQKSNIDIDICVLLINQPNKFNLKVLFLKVKSVQDQKLNDIAILDESSTFLFGHVTNWGISKKISGTLLSVR